MLIKPISNNNHMTIQHKPLETEKRDKIIRPNQIFENYTVEKKKKSTKKTKKVKKKKSY